MRSPSSIKRFYRMNSSPPWRLGTTIVSILSKKLKKNLLYRMSSFYLGPDMDKDFFPIYEK